MIESPITQIGRPKVYYPKRAVVGFGIIAVLMYVFLFMIETDNSTNGISGHQILNVGFCGTLVLFVPALMLLIFYQRITIINSSHFIRETLFKKHSYKTQEIRSIVLLSARSERDIIQVFMQDGACIGFGRSLWPHYSELKKYFIDAAPDKVTKALGTRQKIND